MSDIESTHSASSSSSSNSISHSNNSSIKTEGLYDHRLQADTLPIRQDSIVAASLPPPAISYRDPVSRAPVAMRITSTNSDDEDDFAIQDSPVLNPTSNIRSNTNARPSRLSTSLSNRNTNINSRTSHPIDVVGNGGSLAAAARRGRSRSRSRSFTEQIRTLINPRDADQQQQHYHQANRLSTSSKQSKPVSDASPNLHPVNRSVTRSSRLEENDASATGANQFGQGFDRRRRLTKSSLVDSDADSHASRDSQETEEDVCFPMVPEHVKINGIDFDEIDEFIIECREEDQALLKERLMNTSSDSSSSPKLSSAAKKYTPNFNSTEQKPSQPETEEPGVSFGNNRVEGEDVAPDRFSFFCSESDETVHAPDIQSLVKPGQSIKSLFRSGKPTWWLDCICPTDAEMKCLAKAFGIHPLTAEDIRMQETREKVELFRSYYFVCFHTFESDKESEDFLEPINVYIVVFRDGVLTFHFSPISHGANVRRRVRQLRDYVDVSADWLCYALIDDITDSFAPVIHAIEYEADAIEDSVFLSREMDFSNMLQKIGESRRKVMTLMRLLSGKADVIKMFAKRCQDEANGIGPALTSQINFANLSSGGQVHSSQAQPRADIALYLGDIQDHVVTMFQNLLSYEKIFSRSHSNYLAQLQVESFNSNNKVTEMLSKVTLIGTILVPLNLITGLFGMNVRVPGQDGSNLGWFFGILGVLICLVLSFSVLANWWLTRKAREQEEDRLGSQKKSILGFRRNSNPTVRAKSNRSILSYKS